MKHRTLYLPRDPRLIKNGWEPVPEMAQMPRIVTMESNGKTMRLELPDHFIWCKKELAPLPSVTLDSQPK